MITKAEVNKTLLLLLEEKLRDRGFRKNLSKQALSRKTEYGSQTIHLSLVSQMSHIDVFVDLALRLDQLENLVDSNTTGWVYEKQRQETNSIGIDLGQLIDPSSSKAWPVDKSSDLDSVAESITFDIVLFGLPFLEKCSDIGRAFSILCGPEADLLNIIPLHKALNRVGLAFLLSKTELFEDLTHREVLRLQEIPYSGVDILIEFSEALRKIPS